MFKRLLNSLADSAGSIATKYALRVSVVVPFVLAIGFAIAGLAVYLGEIFGHRDAYLILAGGFAACGLITALAVRWREEKEEADAQQTSEPSAVAATAAKVAVSVPAAIMESASSRKGTKNSWSEALMGWPLLLAAIGLLMVTSSGRRVDRHL